MNKFNTSAVLFLIGTLCLVSCRKQDIKQADVHVPEMKNMACVSVIQNAFRTHAGILSMDFDVESRKVKVIYDSMVLARKNIEFIIAEAGFDAYATESGTQASPEAAAGLPPECRE